MTNDKPASDGGAETPAQKIAGEILAASGYKPVRMTVEERYNAERGIKKVPPLKKPSLWFRFRSAVTGYFVSKKYAEANPDTTVREHVD